LSPPKVLSKQASTLKRWRDRPDDFVREVFSVEPDFWQADALRAFSKHKRVAMKACKGPGKTTVLAWCAWNFLITRPFPKVIATSISAENLSDGLWSEMSKWYETSDILKRDFIITKTKIFHKNYPETWFMVARTWRKDADPTMQANTLAGKHADFMLFILDEVGGIPDSVMVAADGAMTSGIETKILIAGNPTHTTGPLWRAFNEESEYWFPIEITGDPDDPKRSKRVNIDEARATIKKWGRDNPWVLTNVFGKFPPSSINSLLGPDTVREAMARDCSIGQYGFVQPRTGTDVAFGGDDRCCIIGRQGIKVFSPDVFRVDYNSETWSFDIAARILVYGPRIGSDEDLIDTTGGYGDGVYSSLRIQRHKATKVNFSEAAANNDAYYNKRAEMWFTMAEAIKQGACLPNCPELIPELTSPTYTLKNGKMLIEDKEMVKLKIGRSPDIADALAITYALPDVNKKTANLSILRGEGARPRHGGGLRGYNPLDRNR